MQWSVGQCNTHKLCKMWAKFSGIISRPILGTAGYEKNAVKKVTNKYVPLKVNSKNYGSVFRQHCLFL